MHSEDRSSRPLPYAISVRNENDLSNEKERVMSRQLSGIRVAILATDGFEQSASWEPRNAKHREGFCFAKQSRLA